MKVTALGVGDTFSELYPTAALLLEHDGFRLAIDCPDRYRGVLRGASVAGEKPISLDDIDDFFITHVHGDHMNGLEGVAFYKRFVQQRRVRLHTTPDVREVIWDQRLRAPMERLWDGARFHTLSFDDYFDFRQTPWDAVTEIGPFRITLRKTQHHVPTAALVVRAGGLGFGYSSDTAFDPMLIEFLAGADVFVHETNLGPAHTAYGDLLRLPSETRDRMRLIHYPDAFDPRASEIRCLSVGDVLAL